jgi:hypothetical protein
MICDWDVRESTSIRMTPKTQVAGVAMVSDAMVCFTMLIKEGLAPLLESFDTYPAFVDAYKKVESSGIRVASYAGWFLDGHPDRLSKLPFNQKSADFADIIGELGAAATRYYAQTTIGESPALDNAAKQMCSDTARTKWMQLGKAKRQMSATNILQAYGRIKGASTSSQIMAINSLDPTSRSAAVGHYNDQLQKAATAAGVSDIPVITAENVAANAESADRQAQALDTLSAVAQSGGDGM